VKSVGVAAGLGAVFFSASQGAYAQVPPPAPEAIAVGDYAVTPIVESRLRGEYWHDLDAGNRGVLQERSRLGADVQRGAVEAKVVFQDARLWNLGGGDDIIGHPGQLAVTSAYEGWVEAHTAGARPSFVRVGRQPVQWGEGRLLGIADWSPTGRSLDAIRARLVEGDVAIELLGASLSESVPPIESAAVFQGSLISPSYGELFGARLEWALDPLLAAEVYGLVRLAQSNPVVSLGGSVKGQTYTPAVRLHGEAQGWGWGVEGAYQLGHADDIGPNGKDRGAWAAAGHVGYSFEHAQLLPSVRVGLAYASGDDGSATYRAFDPLLPDVHTFTGAMDLFAWSNQEEADARVAIEPWSDASLSLAYRYEQLAEPKGAWRSAYLETIGVSPTNTARSLGHELDLVLVWTPWVPLDLTIGYSALILGDGAKNLVSATATTGSLASMAQFAYGQASLRIP
jgi:hypothetical protein